MANTANGWGCSVGWVDLGLVAVSCFFIAILIGKNCRVLEISWPCEHRFGCHQHFRVLSLLILLLTDRQTMTNQYANYTLGLSWGVENTTKYCGHEPAATVTRTYVIHFRTCLGVMWNKNSTGGRVSTWIKDGFCRLISATKSRI